MSIPYLYLIDGLVEIVPDECLQHFTFFDFDFEIMKACERSQDYVIFGCSVSQM